MSLVLVADDEPAVLEVLSQVVEDLGHDVLRARDGEEALGLARAARPQLVVTDHMMPRLSGRGAVPPAEGATKRSRTCPSSC